MRAVKAVQISNKPTEDVLSLLETFRDMVNRCIHVGLEKNITSRFKLSNDTYHELTECGLHSWYVLSAIEVATTILKNYRKAIRRKRSVRRPYVRRLMAKLGNQAYKIVSNQLRIPLKPKEYFYVELHKRALQFLSDSTLKMGSVTLTARTVVVVFSKTAEVMEPKGYVAFDTNEKSLDGAYLEKGDIKTVRYDLTNIVEIRHGYFERVRRVQIKYGKDRRISRNVQRRLFGNQNNRVNSILHKVSSEIIRQAEKDNRGIILEDIKQIHKLINRKVPGINKFNHKIQDF